MEPFADQGIWTDASAPNKSDNPSKSDGSDKSEAVQEPKKPNESLVGTLSLSSKGGARLELMGSFVPIEVLNEDANIAVVHGVVKRRQITLFDVKLVGNGIAAPGFLTTVYQVGTVVLGIHLPDPNRLATTTLSCRMNHLGSWTGLSGLSMSMSHDSNDELVEYSQAYSYPEAVRGTYDGIGFSIESVAKSNQDRKSLTYQIREGHRIKFSCKTPLSFSEWVDRALEPWQSFLSLATRKLIQFTHVFIHFPETMPSGVTKLRAYEVYSDKISWTESAAEFPTIREQLFSLNDIKLQLPEMIQAYLDHRRNSKSIPALAASVLERPGLSPQTQFFEEARSLEAYHREHLSLSDHDEEFINSYQATAKASIPDDLPEDFIRWASDRLSVPYEEPLRKRLKSMMEDWRSLLDPLLGNSALSQKFQQLTLNIRNCYAHGSAESCEGAATDADLAYISSLLGLIAEAYLLREMTLPMDDINEMLMSKEWFGNMTNFRNRTQSFAVSSQASG